jgi:LPS-assembly lipoprotein
MSLFDRTFARRRLLSISTVAVAGFLSACQVQPLYGNRSVTESMATVGISDPSTRVEQVVRNQLIFLLSGGAGEPENPVYQLQLKVTSSNNSFISVTSSNLPLPGRVTLVAKYALLRDGVVIKQGQQKMDAQLDYPSQRFAQVRAVRDAENQAARELAELLKFDIARAIKK